jgi:hypothetical protein
MLFAAWQFQAQEYKYRYSFVELEHVFQQAYSKHSSHLEVDQHSHASQSYVFLRF